MTLRSLFLHLMIPVAFTLTTTAHAQDLEDDEPVSAPEASAIPTADLNDAVNELSKEQGKPVEHAAPAPKPRAKAAAAPAPKKVKKQAKAAGKAAKKQKVAKSKKKSGAKKKKHHS